MCNDMLNGIMEQFQQASETSENILAIFSEFANKQIKQPRRASLHGEVKTRKMTSEELERCKTPTPFATSMSVRKQRDFSTKISAGVVKRIIERTLEPVAFAKELGRHYGMFIPYDKAMEIAERAYYKNLDTVIE